MRVVENDIMTLEEVAAYLRLKPQTIYTWAQEKKIPAAKLGKEWRFKKSIVDEWFVRHIDEKFSDVVNDWKEKQKNRGSGKNIEQK
ncbi:MAG TPA: helix-turn-helix domain-containing protein [Planctomycetes bacterium]|nr:helix-turn-helix domain-containing protein [Planctomycetota bacterium]